MRSLAAQVARLQRAQLSVQALTRLCSISVFLLASRWDGDHLALVALQGILLAIPYTLIEALVGRPLATDIVPHDWDLGRWAGQVALAVALPVAVVGYVSASVALPQTTVAERMLMLAPVILQLAIEAVFWATTRARSPQHANLIPQLTAVGTILGAVTCVAVDLPVYVAAVPAQTAVLLWCLLRRPPADAGRVRPTVRRSLSLGAMYCYAGAVDLSYSIALPSVAGSVAGPASVTVLRAMDLAFGPFHVALSASTREDVVAGRKSRWLTGARAMTVATLVAVCVIVLGSRQVRGLLAEDFASLGVAVLAAYCGYKALVMVSAWLSTRHMIWAPPRRYLGSAVGSRTIAFAGVAAAVVWAGGLSDLVLLLLVAEALVVGWFLVRMRLGGTGRDSDSASVAVLPAGGVPVGR
ncbi:hypothetical protein [Micromonospora sp. NPDC093277]|uniref:hypothetical protein n=1 Tax=Micromonospora sp. NPDC093277 TaxID=3364291 RepID=UPI003813023E